MDAETKTIIKNLDRFFHLARIPLKKERRKKIEFKATRIKTRGLKKEDYRQ
jgi:hypothetical protein